MDGDIKVSVIIPIYNAGEWLSHTLSCLSSQKMSTLEFVCVLDCPTDGSDNVVTAFAELDNRFVVVRNESNAGVAASRNMGIKNARGEYIGFMDHDDWCENDMYEQLYIAAKNGDCDVVISDVVVEYAEQKKIERTPTDISNEELIDSLLYPVDSHLCKSRLARSVWHSIYKKTFLQDNDIYFLDRKEYWEEDTLFNLKVFTSSPKWIVLNMPLYHWNLKREVCEVNYRGHDDLNVFANYVRKVVECLSCDDRRIADVVSWYIYQNGNLYRSMKSRKQISKNYPILVSYLSLYSIRKILGKKKWEMEVRRNYICLIRYSRLLCGKLNLRIALKIKKKLLSYKGFYGRFYRFLIRKKIAGILRNDDVYRLKGPVVLIDEGEYQYPFFNAYYVQNMFGLILTSIAIGCIPHICLKNRKRGYLNWETFFCQPYLTDFSQVVSVFPLRRGLVNYWLPLVHQKEELLKWSRCFSQFFVLNEETKSKIDHEYECFQMNQHKVLGVICRGTDYLVLKPTNHPIQPDVDEVVKMVEGVVGEYDKIYLATEDGKILDAFKSRFGDLIIDNNKILYDKQYKEMIDKGASKNNDITNVKLGIEDENYKRGYDYLSSMVLLSRCDALIGGNCGGTLLSLLLNQGKFEYVYIFDKGYY